MDFNPLHFLPDIFNSHMLMKYFMAFILSALIGMERDMHGRPAGLRTNILVAMGACTFSVVSIYAAHNSSGLQIADPTRITAQIVTGIGFIGAGAILKQGFNIKGLTTAATLWISAAIGVACGSGYVELGILCTIFSLITLQLLNLLERLLPKDLYRKLEIKSELDGDISDVIVFLKQNKARVASIDHSYDYETKQALHIISLKLKTRSSVPLKFHAIKKKLEECETKIYSVNWTE